MAESRKKLKTSNLFSSFIVSLNRNRSALVRELLCNNSLFVGQLYKDKSLAVRTRDLIFFKPLSHCHELGYDLLRVMNSPHLVENSPYVVGCRTQLSSYRHNS